MSLLYRLYRARPDDPPLDAKGLERAPLVGDYPSKAKAVAAAKVNGEGAFYIEPIEFNDDPQAPKYKNKGAIEALK